MSKQNDNPFLEYQKQFFEIWKENLAKVPGMDAYKKACENMMPEGVADYWKNFSSMMPGADQYWKAVSSMMPDMSSFMNMWPYKIPGFDTYSKVFSFWKGMSDPANFAKNFQDNYMDLMQDLFKNILPEGASAFMQRPMDFMDTCVNYYRQNIAPFMKIDDDIMARIAKGDLSAYTDFFRSFNAQYEESIGKYFNMMGLGLNRESNEDYMKAMSAYNKAMFATGELMSMVMTTCAESMTKLTTAMQDALTKGKAPTTFREFYDLWSSVTEEELMKLLDTDEFSKAFDNFSDMYSQYMSATNKVYERMLAPLPIPTNKDMKSLYKTVYELRKDVRDLKRAVAAMQEK